MRLISQILDGALATRSNVWFNSLTSVTLGEAAVDERHSLAVRTMLHAPGIYAKYEKCFNPYLDKEVVCLQAESLQLEFLIRVHRAT